MEQRLFHRVTFYTPCDVTHHGITYSGSVENLSLRGALISSDECIIIPDAENCTLRLSPPGDAPPIIITVEVIHSFFSMIGVKFVQFEGDSEFRLYELMQKITNDPALLRHEWENILSHRESDAV